MSKEEIYKKILTKLNGNLIRPISDILPEIGLDIEMADAYEDVLTRKGYIECSKQGCFLKPAGKSYLFGLTDEPLSFKSNSATKEEVQDQDLMDSKIDEIIEHLKKAGVEREILFEELQELKELYSKLSKKNWGQIVLGKMADLALSKLIEKETFNYVCEQLTGAYHKLL